MPIFAASTFASFDSWKASPQGAYLLARERALYDRIVADIFGFNAMQLGFEGVDLLQACRIPHRAHAGEGQGEVLTSYAELPVASGSLDLLLMPHVLEFSSNPHQVLREAERVLIAEGQVVISGFNPWSLWGFQQQLARRPAGYPWHGRFISLRRLKDWLALLGFEIVGGRYCCYAPPFHTPRWLERFGFMEKAGDRWWAVAGGVYIVQARKRVRGMRLITPAWKDTAVARPGFATAAQKTKIRAG